VKRLEDRVAVVTGGAGGIGLALGRAFGEAGMRVVLADIGSERLEEATAGLTEAGIDAHGVVCDVSDVGSVRALHDATVKQYGAVHVVCNNAGIGAGAEGPMWEHEERDWEWAFAVNLWGVINGITTFVPTLLAQGDEGHVVNTSSGNGGVAPLPQTPQYAVTKAGVVTLTECLYAQLQDAGSAVGASVLFPGPNMLRTGIFSSWRSASTAGVIRPRSSATSGSGPSAASSARNNSSPGAFTHSPFTAVSSPAGMAQYASKPRKWSSLTMS